MFSQLFLADALDCAELQEGVGRSAGDIQELKDRTCLAEEAKEAADGALERSEKLCRLALESRDTLEARVGVLEAEVRKYMAELAKLQELSASLEASTAWLQQDVANERSTIEAEQKDHEGK